MGIETKYYTNANEPKSLGLASAAVGQIPKIKAVNSNGVPTEWEAADMASELLIVKITDNNGTLSADKTYNDIRDAILSGTTVLVGYDGKCIPLMLITAGPLFFGATTFEDNPGEFASANSIMIEITENSEVHDLSGGVYIPETMPNPFAITFTGAVTGSYDGSAPMSVNIPTVPTKTSQLTNDSGFLTSHQSLAAYRTAAAQDKIDSGKVDKVTGKGLSTNDYTASAKAKVDAIPANPKYTDTVYDDTALKERVATIEGKESAWDAKLNASELPTAINTALAQAKASGEFDGADGKSAYAYAVESGYTGTEAEFAAKLAEEIPTVDDTLTQSGQAADASVVGNRLSALSKEIVTTSESKVAAHNTGTDTHSDIRLLIQGLTDRLNTLADSDDTTLDQLSEVVAYIKSNRSLIEAITTSKVSVADIIDNLTTNVSNKPLSAAQGVALKALIDAISIPDALPNPNALTFTGAVTSTYDGSESVTINIPESGAGDMKKLTFTGAATGEYDGTTDVSIDIPSDVYVVQIDMDDTLVNDFDELVSAIKSHKNIIALFGTDFMVAVDVSVNSISTEVDLSVVSGNLLTYISIAKNTKKAKLSYLYCLGMEYGEGFSPKSGVVYFDETTGVCSTKDSVSPIATTSTAGIIKVGNGLSISADGTLSVTTATYYTGTADPVNTLGADGDLYLKTEG